MRKFIVIAASAFAAAVASLILISQADAAPDQTGQTFAEAKAALAQAGYSVVVSTTVGDQLSQNDCLVVRQETTTASPFSGGDWTGGTDFGASGTGSKPQVLLSLDCSKQRKQ